MPDCKSPLPAWQGGCRDVNRFPCKCVAGSAATAIRAPREFEPWGGQRIACGGWEAGRL